MVFFPFIYFRNAQELELQADVRDDPFNFLLHISQNWAVSNLSILVQWTKFVLTVALSIRKLSCPLSVLLKISFG